MKTKLGLACAAALLALALLRFGPPPTAPTVCAPAVHSSLVLPSGSASSAARLSAAALVPPRREPVSLVSNLLAQLARCDPDERQAEIQRFVDGHDLAGLQELLEDEIAVMALPEDVMQAMLRRLAHEAAAWTADYLTTLPDDTFRGELAYTVAAEWGAADLPAAIAWAKNLGEPSLQETALVNLSYRWFETDPEGALAFAALHPVEHRQMLTTLVSIWSWDQPEAAAAWGADFMPAEPELLPVMAAAMAAWAQKDDLAAAEFVLKLPPGPLREQATISMMAALAQSDPALGTQWLALFPSGAGRDSALENLAYGWAPSDSTAALAWSSRLPDGERDTALFAGAGGLMDTNPALAATWAMAIQDESRRFQQAERAARQWLDVDPSAARQWILTSTLPDSQKLALIQHPES